LAKGAEAFGFRGQVWTAARVAQVIKRAFGVSYHPTHGGRLLSAIKHSRQKPETRASQRDEQAIQVWRDHHSLELKKRPARKGARWSW
jgi:transposase